MESLRRPPQRGFARPRDHGLAGYRRLRARERRCSGERPATRVSLAAIEPSYRDWSDLEAFGRDIGDAQVVLLGEPSHLDGSALLAKARVVAFLHERLAFDLLVWEAGLWSCESAKDPITTSKCLGWPWSRAAEARTAMAYGARTAGATRLARASMPFGVLAEPAWH